MIIDDLNYLEEVSAAASGAGYYYLAVEVIDGELKRTSSKGTFDKKQMTFNKNTSSLIMDVINSQGDAVGSITTSMRDGENARDWSWNWR